MRKSTIFFPSEVASLPSLNQHLVQLLTDAILYGKIKPGARLNEVQLARQLNVSRTPVREALHQLQAQGLAVSRPRRGIFVIDLSQEDVQKINGLRIILEAEALRLCKRNLTPLGEKQLIRLVEKIEGMEPLPAMNALQLDLEFHNLIWSMTGNEYLNKTLAGLTKPLFAEYAMSLPNKVKQRKVVDSPRPMLEFVRGKSKQSAEQIILEHLSGHYDQPEKFSSLFQGR
jgi:DNA-binding GntR family transcriptional regulator